jgi:tyrosyl-tRNA synthetase
VKFGIDPTRDRLHLGHFVPIRLCRRLQEQGHELHLILGTITARLGDPSGQDSTRPILDDAEVKANAERLLAQCRKVLLPGFTVHRNHEFVDAMDVPFLLTRLAARITVKAMLARNGFRARMERDQPIGLHELLVPLLQGWDSVVVQADVEIGGTDQLFNFQVARQLQQAEGQEPEHCLMTPVIRGTDGRKMSKSFGNTVWLDEAPEQMFGQVMSISDDVMAEWVDLLTDLTHLPEHPMERKLVLAHDIVRQLHGAGAADLARAHFDRTVRERRVTEEDLDETPVADLVTLVVAVRGASRTQARKLIQGGGVRVDGAKVTDHEHQPSAGSVVRVGKRKVVRVV